MEFLLTYNHLLIALFGLTLLVLFVIIGLRLLFKKRTFSHLTGKNLFKNTSILHYNKYEEVNGFRFSGVLFRFGVFIALAGTLFSFSVTEFERKPYVFELGNTGDILEELPPITFFKKPLPPPPPPPKVEIIEIPEEIENQPEFLDESIDEEDPIDEYVFEEPIEEPTPEPPPQILEPIDDVEEIILFPEQNPRFPGCENIAGTRKEKEECSRKKLLEYIYSEVKYPSMALEVGIEGTVVIQFVVNKKGNISDIQIVRGIGGGCDQEALNVVKGMNEKKLRWTPGKQRNREVNVKYTLPIKFKLQ